MSKELEALDRLTSFIQCWTRDYTYIDDVETIEKSLKALEIIKENIIEIIDNDTVFNDELIIRFRKIAKPRNADLLKEVLL